MQRHSDYIRKMIASIRKVNRKLFIALLLMELCPAVYTTVRTYLLGTLPGEWSYSIAGQLSWVNLIYEILNEAIILPLFFLIGKNVNDRKVFTNKIRSGLLITFVLYSCLSMAVMLFAEPLLKAMAASPELIEPSAVYIRIESVAGIFAILFNFACVAIIAIGKTRDVYVLTGIKMILCIVSDIVLVRSFGVNGIGFSNIAVNLILFMASLSILHNNGCVLISKEKLSFGWASEFAKKGGLSAAESFVRNITYMLMISRMVNIVGEQGTYWVANNFIWGWLLLPVSRLGELIKQETSSNRNAVRDNTPAYLLITAVICILWVVLIPAYKPFMKYVLNYDDVEKLYSLVMVLLGSYMMYAFQNVFDSTFYGTGSIGYMLFESVITNTFYYGFFFVLYLTRKWTPTLMGIAILFGMGNIFDSIVSAIAYRHFLRKNRIRIGSAG